MRTILHVLTAPADDLVAGLIQQQQTQAGAAGFIVQVADLATAEPPNYDALLDQIFAADSISVW